MGKMIATTNDEQQTVQCPQCYAPAEYYYDAHADCTWIVCLTVGCGWSCLLEDD